MMPSCLSVWKSRPGPATPVDKNGDRVSVSSNVEVFSLYDTVPGPDRLLSEQEVGSDETPYSRDGWILLNKTDPGTRPCKNICMPMIRSWYRKQLMGSRKGHGLLLYLTLYNLTAW